MPHCFQRAGLAMAVLTAVAAVSIAPASAASERLRNACTSDYLKFCSQYDPDSHQTVLCMNRHQNRLSSTCRRIAQEEGLGPAAKRTANRSR